MTEETAKEILTVLEKIAAALENIAADQSQIADSVNEIRIQTMLG